jgi:hypothetical protein
LLLNTRQAHLHFPSLLPDTTTLSPPSRLSTPPPTSTPSARAPSLRERPICSTCDLCLRTWSSTRSSGELPPRRHFRRLGRPSVTNPTISFSQGRGYRGSCSLQRTRLRHRRASFFSPRPSFRLPELTSLHSSVPTGPSPLFRQAYLGCRRPLSNQGHPSQALAQGDRRARFLCLPRVRLGI